MEEKKMLGIKIDHVNSFIKYENKETESFKNNQNEYSKCKSIVSRNDLNQITCYKSCDRIYQIHSDLSDISDSKATLKYSKKELYKKQKEYFNKKLKKGRTSIERIQDNNVAQNLCILTQRSNQADHAIMNCSPLVNFEPPKLLASKSSKSFVRAGSISRRKSISQTIEDTNKDKKDVTKNSKFGLITTSKIPDQSFEEFTLNESTTCKNLKTRLNRNQSNMQMYSASVKNLSKDFSK